MYIGRFAPTPSGGLHLGSIMIAIASFLDARLNNGRWHLKIDDLDRFRTKQKHIDQIKAQLHELNLSWDNEIIYQSRRVERYEYFFNQLKKTKKTYICSCSRKKILEESESGVDGFIYSGFCRNMNYKNEENNSIRITVNDEPIIFKDGLQGEYKQNINNEIGDFVIKRSDNIFSYQLAVVIDDHIDRTSHIIRGSDLLESTPRQIYIQRILGFKNINYTHLPTLSYRGRKLSKSNGDNYLIKNQPKNIWLFVLKLLNQTLPARNSSLDSIIEFAIKNWDIKKIKQRRFIEIDDYIRTS